MEAPQSEAFEPLMLNQPTSRATTDALRALNQFEPVTLSEADTRLAQESSRKLAAFLEELLPKQLQSDFRLQLLQGDKPGEVIALPLPALRLLFTILKEMGEGNAVTLMPVHAELTTQQAADILNVSRPFFIGLLEEGKIAFRKVGTHRRVLLHDVMEYKKNIDANRLKALEELSAQAQELNMGY